MKSQTAIEQKPKDAPPFFVAGETLLNHMHEISGIIARRAFELFEERGGKMHNPLDDWFRAESELLRPLPVEISETERTIIVRAETPGFSAEEIRLSVDPKRLVICGDSGVATGETVGRIIYNERRAKQFCRCLPLPAEIEPASAAATFKDGLLEVFLEKVNRK